jgi:hypothetical protein
LPKLAVALVAEEIVYLWVFSKYASRKEGGGEEIQEEATTKTTRYQAEPGK